MRLERSRHGFPYILGWKSHSFAAAADDETCTMNKLKTVLRKLIPPAVQKWRMHYGLLAYRGKSNAEIFGKVYKNNVWGGERGELCSGVGTYDGASKEYVDKVVQFISEHNISSITDIGCGDFYVGKQIVERSGKPYLGIDVAPNVISDHNQKHAGDKVRFMMLDASTDQVPESDLILIRQVLQHLSNEQISRVIRNALARCRFLIVTEHIYTGPGLRYNIDKASGPDTRVYEDSGVFLERWPFNIEIQETLLECPQDSIVFGRNKPATLRTSLILGQLSSLAGGPQPRATGDATDKV